MNITAAPGGKNVVRSFYSKLRKCFQYGVAVPLRRMPADVLAFYFFAGPMRFISYATFTPWSQLHGGSDSSHSAQRLSRLLRGARIHHTASGGITHSCAGAAIQQRTCARIAHIKTKMPSPAPSFKRRQPRTAPFNGVTHISTQRPQSAL